MVALSARVACTFPAEVQKNISLVNGQTQFLSVTNADTRRNDLIFSSCGKMYAVEFKLGTMDEYHVHNSLIRRRYHLVLKTTYGDRLAGIVFVGDEVAQTLSCDILETWSETVGVEIAALPMSRFARVLVLKILQDAVKNKDSLSFYAKSQLLSQLHVLTTASDGYPAYYQTEWVQSLARKYIPKILS